MKRNFGRRVYEMYRDGFRQMTVGRWLWAIVIIKIIVFFLVLKLFFFPNLLQRDYSNDRERADAVRRHLANPQSPQNHLLLFQLSHKIEDF